MLTSFYNIGGLIILGVAGFFMIKKIRGYQKPKHTPPKDPISQKLYEESHSPPKDETLKLTLQERIELSWQFLTDITEKIMNYFSMEDQQLIKIAGNQLLRNGATYQHDVDQELYISSKLTKSRIVQKSKEASIEHSR